MSQSKVTTQANCQKSNEQTSQIQTPIPQEESPSSASIWHMIQNLGQPKQALLMKALLVQNEAPVNNSTLPIAGVQSATVKSSIVESNQVDKQ